MSRDIIVLTPNGRRQKIHCTPDTSILQILENACLKQGISPSDYTLKHHNNFLDLSTTIRFSNLPNKATVEIVEADKKREETQVTIGLMLEDGDRRTADFHPSTSLFDLIMSLAPNEFSLLQQPTIIYMRQEVVGVTDLKEKTLRQLGLLKGRAILRLLNKADEARQANVSSVYRRATPNVDEAKDNITLVNAYITKADQSKNIHDDSTPGPSKTQQLDPINKFRKEIKANLNPIETNISNESSVASDNKTGHIINEYEKMDIDSEELNRKTSVDSNLSSINDNLERRLRIEEEVTFLGSCKAIAFMLPDNIVDDLEDLPNDFYELSVDEVRKLYHEMKQQRILLENTPLMTSMKKEEINKQASAKMQNVYKNVVVRVQFPDQVILQGVFLPTNTVGDIINFIKEYITYPEKKFHIFTIPLKESLNPELSLLEAKFVPCVHMHFKWVNDDGNLTYLKREIYSSLTECDAANILASKYRAPSRRRSDEKSDNSQRSGLASTSTSKNSKLPKWFKQ